MLRKIRTGIAIVSFSLLTLLFLDFTGATHGWLNWLAQIQLIPALLALDLVIIILLLLLTILFGRVYCSVICPLGILQDIISKIAGKRKKRRFKYSPAIKWLRYSFLLIFVVALIAGISSIVAFLDPYGIYGRITSNLFSPVYKAGNNLLAYFAQRIDSYTFYHVEIWMKNLPTFIVAGVSLIIIGILAWRNGRIYCNTICPVGTVLGFLSRFSIFKPVLDSEKCNECNLCASNCKSSCIDTKNHAIDYSRCVTCMDCIDTCKRDAINYQPFFKAQKTAKKTSVSTSRNEKNPRREFLTIASLLALSSTLKAQEKIVEGGLAVIEKKKIPERTTAITPPGSESARNFTQHCTACGLCISACPNQVLRPSSKLITFMQPEMSFEIGYCRPECTSCGDVCPTDAISDITKEEKSSTKIGSAVWIKNNCVVITDDVNCGNCAKHCPTGAITMIPIDANNSDSRKIPAINTERCIGCGACENLCPARPFSAIYVEGIEVHRLV